MGYGLVNLLVCDVFGFIMDDRFQPCQSASGILKGVETTSHMHLLGGKKLMFLQHHNTKPHFSSEKEHWI